MVFVQPLQWPSIQGAEIYMGEGSYGKNKPTETDQTPHPTSPPGTWTHDPVVNKFKGGTAVFEDGSMHSDRSFVYVSQKGTSRNCTYERYIHIILLNCLDLLLKLEAKKKLYVVQMSNQTLESSFTLDEWQLLTKMSAYMISVRWCPPKKHSLSTHPHRLGCVYLPQTRSIL